MKTSERFFYYGVGFLIGMAIVSMILSRRAAKRDVAEDPWFTHNQQIEAIGAEPLPEATEAAMLNGQVLRFGYLPNAETPKERVWLLNFAESYPYVRVVESIESGELSYMAADQVKLELKDGVDPTELTSMLDELGLRLRMFNRKERVVVIGVLNTEIDAVPATLKAIEPWSDRFVSMGPDLIEFRSGEGSFFKANKGEY